MTYFQLVPQTSSISVWNSLPIKKKRIFISYLIFCTWTTRRCLVLMNWSPVWWWLPSGHKTEKCMKPWWSILWKIQVYRDSWNLSKYPCLNVLNHVFFLGRKARERKQVKPFQINPGSRELTSSTNDGRGSPRVVLEDLSFLTNTVSVSMTCMTKICQSFLLFAFYRT